VPGARPRAFVAVLVIDLHFPEAASLANRIGAAVSEVGHQDTWQRAMLVAALTADAPGRLEEVGDAVQRWLDARFPEGARVQRTLHSLEDLAG
jgi:uncharacterized protein YlxP (DUF503 family)